MKNRRIPVLCLSLLLSGSLTLHAQTINLGSNRISLKTAFEKIEKASKYKIAYNSSLIDANRIVTVVRAKGDVIDVLRSLLSSAGYTYEQNGNYITVKPNANHEGKNQRGKDPQRRKITGRVLDTSGEPVVGATVLVKGSNNGTITDIDGNYTLNDVPENAEITISYVGFTPHTFKATDRNLAKVTLQEDSKVLNEIVVVGYGTQRKKLITGSTVQLSGDELTNLSASNPIEAMQISTPGLQVTQNGGNPDAGYKFFIRGIGTLGNSAPLIIVDGLVGADLNSISPSDIESIDVLKDAASSAIYGSRAANGVIIVTTKKGKEGKTQITYDGYYGFQDVPNVLHAADAKTYMQMLNEASDYEGTPRYDYAALVPNFADIESGKFKGTDWVEESMNKNAPVTNHAVNISGGNPMSTYSIGFSYLYQEGTFGEPKPLKYSRYTGRVNSDHVLIKTDKGINLLKLGENILLIDKYKKNPDGRLSLRDVFSAAPFLPVRDATGGYSHTTAWTSNYSINPIAMRDLRSGDQKQNSLSLQANAYLELQPIKDLILRSSYTLNYGNTSKQVYVSAYNLGAGMINSDSRVEQNEGHSIGHLLENTLNYKFRFNDKLGYHSFDVLVGQSLEHDGLGANMSGSNINPILGGLDFAYLDNTQQIISGKTKLGGSPNTVHKLVSFFGRINYDYAETYMASVILRADASSNFARGHRWGYFPSVSGGWVISNEKFMTPISSWLDFLKIRASWGLNGNEDIANFQYLSTVNSKISYDFGNDKSVNTTGSYFDILPNPNITWEKSEQFDIGIDARFLNSRLGFTFDYYDKRTRDWLVQAPSLSSNGTGAPYINGGEIKNNGVEFALTWNDHVSDFSYGANFSGAFNHNEVMKLGNGKNQLSYIQSRNGWGVARAQVGFPVSYFYGYKSAGIFQTEEEIKNYKGAKLDGARPGDIIWVDNNNNGKIDPDDRTKIGTPHPSFTYSAGINMAWKGFDFSASGYGQAGLDVWMDYRGWSDVPKANFTMNYVNGRWHGPGTSNKLPRMSSAGHTNWADNWYSSQRVESGNFFRIENVTLGYDFNQLLKKSPFHQLRFYFTVKNLCIITNYSGMDPEVGWSGQDWAQGLDYGEAPRPRSFIFGVNVKF